MADDDEEQQVVERQYEESYLIHTDIKNQDLIDKIVKYANDAFENSTSDKEICSKLKVLLDKDASLNEPSNPQKITGFDEHGVWQCIIGRQFCASVTFDAEYLCYFCFPKQNKYFMIFRS